MSFNLQVKVDPSGAVPAIKSVVGEMEKAEVRAKELGRAASKAFEGIAHQMKIEHDMLTRIHAPMKQLEADMRALDNLHQRGAVSARQYATELERIGKAAGLSRGNPMDAVSLPGMPKAGPSNYQKMNEFMGGQGAMAAGSVGLAALGHAAVEESDRWDNYANALRKFEKPGHDVSAIMAEHIGLAKDLHAAMEPTIALYDGVEGAMQDLYPTSKQLVDATRQLGRVMELDGKSLEQGARVMETLEYAMSTGVITTRELKGIMKEFPDIADLWSTSLGKSRKEILDLADKGKLDITKLVMAFTQGSDTIDEKWSKRTKTWGESWREFKDAVGRPIDLEAAFQQHKWDQLSVAEKQALEDTEKLTQGMKRLDSGLADVQAKLDKASNLLGDKMGAAGQFKIGGKAAFGAMLLDPKLIDEDMLTARKAMDKFDKDLDKWKKHVEEYKAVWESVKGPMHDMHRDQAILNDMFARGKINITEYNTAVDKLIDAMGGSEFNAILKSAGAPKFLNPNSLGAEKRDMEASFSQGDSADLDSGPTDLDLQMARAERKWRKTSDPILKVTGEWKDATAATKAWNAELRQNTMQADALGQTYDGLRNGLNSINESINVAAQAQKTLEDGFNGISDAITDMVTKGKTDINSLVQTLLTDMTKLLLFQGLRSIIGGGGGGGAIPFTSLPGFASGGMIGPGGTGGTDSQLVMLRKSPDETVRVNTPGMERAYRGGGGTTVVNVSDPKQAAIAALNSPEGVALIMNVIHSNIQTIRGHVNKR